MIFLGTAACQLIPDPYCTCPVCTRARASGDPRDIRGNSALWLDEHNLIDFGPTVPMASNYFRAPLTDLRNLFITHSHSDHWCLTTLEDAIHITGPKPYIRIFTTKEVRDGLMNLMEAKLGLNLQGYESMVGRMQKISEFIVLTPYQTCEIDDMEVTPVRAFHGGDQPNETGVNYLIRREGKNFLYATDTGIFPETTFEYLAGRQLSTLVIEGTFGVNPNPSTVRHLTLDSLETVLNRLRAQGTVDDSTRIYITHIAHSCGMTHSEYCTAAAARLGAQVTVAYDGLSVPMFEPEL